MENRVKKPGAHEKWKRAYLIGARKILRMEAIEEISEHGFITLRNTNSPGWSFYKRARDVFFTQEEAISAAQKHKKAKIESLKKQIEKWENWFPDAEKF